MIIDIEKYKLNTVQYFYFVEVQNLHATWRVQLVNDVQTMVPTVNDQYVELILHNTGFDNRRLNTSRYTPSEVLHVS